MSTYFGFAIADSMFAGNATIKRIPITDTRVWHIVLDGVTSCLNPSHKPTIEAMRLRFCFDVAVPDKAPIVTLNAGDRLVVMSVRGLPRLEGRHEYTSKEIAEAQFSFALYVVDDGLFGRIRRAVTWVFRHLVRGRRSVA